MREKFIERDDKAIEMLNKRNYGFGGPMSLEERLYFVETRLADLCVVVVKLLEELEKESIDKIK
jgi:hypothetical protein